MQKSKQKNLIGGFDNMDRIIFSKFRKNTIKGYLDEVASNAKYSGDLRQSLNDSEKFKLKKYRIRTIIEEVDFNDDDIKLIDLINILRNDILEIKDSHVHFRSKNLGFGNLDYERLNPLFSHFPYYSIIIYDGGITQSKISQIYDGYNIIKNRSGIVEVTKDIDAVFFEVSKFIMVSFYRESGFCNQFKLSYDRPCILSKEKEL